MKKPIVPSFFSWTLSPLAYLILQFKCVEQEKNLNHKNSFKKDISTKSSNPKKKYWYFTVMPLNYLKIEKIL